MLVFWAGGERFAVPAAVALFHTGSLLAAMAMPSGPGRAPGQQRADDGSWVVENRAAGAVRAMLSVVLHGPRALPVGDLAALKAVYEEAAYWRLQIVRDAVRDAVRALAGGGSA
jgi:hypothetical protein